MLSINMRPSGEDSGYDRCNRWSRASLRSGIKLEDCTRCFLGTLPQDDEYKDELSENDYDDDDEQQWGMGI